MEDDKRWREIGEMEEDEERWRGMRSDGEG